jgi:hypothetical protein
LGDREECSAMARIASSARSILVCELFLQRLNRLLSHGLFGGPVQQRGDTSYPTGFTMSRKNFEANNSFSLISTLTRKEGMSTKRSQRNELQQISSANPLQKMQIVRTLSCHDCIWPPQSLRLQQQWKRHGTIANNGLVGEGFDIQADLFNYTSADASLTNLTATISTVRSLLRSFPTLWYVKSRTLY